MYNILLPPDFKESAKQLSRGALQNYVFCMQKTVPKRCKNTRELGKSCIVVQIMIFDLPSLWSQIKETNLDTHETSISFLPHTLFSMGLQLYLFQNVLVVLLVLLKTVQRLVLDSPALNNQLAHFLPRGIFLLLYQYIISPSFSL